MSHHHHHGQHPTRYNRAFFISVWSNGIFVILQIAFAVMAHSTSLLADAIHNVGDVLSLILAWGTLRLGQRKPTAKASYGLKKTSILAALINGLLLVFSCGIIATEAFYKFLHPVVVEAYAVIIIASVGILVNGGTALLFKGGHNDLNIRGAFLHLAYDALISLGVVIAAILMLWTGWLWLDPVVGVLIAVIILKGTWSLFADSFRLMIDAVPRDIKLSDVKALFEQMEGVTQVHDLHIWALSTHENALSVHLCMPEIALTDPARSKITHLLAHEFGIQHVTIQVEQDLTYCEDACAL